MNEYQNTESTRRYAAERQSTGIELDPAAVKRLGYQYMTVKLRGGFNFDKYSKFEREAIARERVA